MKFRRNVIVDFFKNSKKLRNAVALELNEEKNFSKSLRIHTYRCDFGESSAIYLENKNCSIEHVFVDCEHCYEDYNGRKIDKHYD